MMHDIALKRRAPRGGADAAGAEGAGDAKAQGTDAADGPPPTEPVGPSGEALVGYMPPGRMLTFHMSEFLRGKDGPRPGETYDCMIMTHPATREMTVRRMSKVGDPQPGWQAPEIPEAFRKGQGPAPERPILQLARKQGLDRGKTDSPARAGEGAGEGAPTRPAVQQPKGPDGTRGFAMGRGKGAAAAAAAPLSPLANAFRPGGNSAPGNPAPAAPATGDPPAPGSTGRPMGSDEADAQSAGSGK